MMLTSKSFELGLQTLSSRDLDLERILDRLGPPPMWSREPGFPTLVWIILEQQVSLASARAAFERLLSAASPLTPEKFLTFDDPTLKTIGFSRQKTRYCRELSRSILDGLLDLEQLGSADDSTVRERLIRIKGIGPWTAEIYLLMALCRPDAWPTGDLALASALQRVKGLPELPTPAVMEAVGENWRPWRAVAARLLWHFYLNGGL